MSECVVSLGALGAWTRKVLERAGATAQAAEATAEVLVDANRRGLDSHGVLQLRFYLPALHSGATDGLAVPEVASDLPAVAIVDGHDGLGPFVARFAMDVCCRKAEEMGAAVVGVRNSGHFGAASCYAEQAARRSCVAIVFSNSDPGMSPLGALGPILGTNPLAVAAPLVDGKLVSLDIATSVAALSKVVLAGNQAREIPAGWAIDSAGRPTTDARRALEGAMLPMSGHKGFALAFMIDVLCGCLTGAAVSPDIPNGQGSPRPQRTGHLLIAVHLDAVADRSRYHDSIERLARAVHDGPRAAGVPPFMLPGEPELAIARERAGNGVPFDAATAQELRMIGESHEAPFPG